MRAKVLILTCAALAAALFLCAKTSRNLAALEQSYECAGEVDLTLEELERRSPETLGRIYSISAGRRASNSDARNLAEGFARKRQQDERWVQRFMHGFHSRRTSR